MYIAVILFFVACVLAVAAPNVSRKLRIWRAKRDMDRRFIALVARMQMPQAKAAFDALLTATPEKLAAVRAAYMRHERSMYRIQLGLPPDYEDIN